MKNLVTVSPRIIGFTALGVLTAIGLAFAVQLRWYYGVPWTASIFWGLSDWYLWGLLGVTMAFAARCMERKRLDRGVRVVLLLIAAPILIALHVLLTILVGAFYEPIQSGFTETFGALFSKKLTLNIITFVTLAWLVHVLVGKTTSSARTILAKRGETSRWVHRDEIITAEALGNYVKLNTDDGHWLIRSTLGNAGKELGTGFIRVSRFRLVNRMHIEGFREDSPHLVIMLSDQSETQVAKRRRAVVRRELLEHEENLTR